MEKVENNNQSNWMMQPKEIYGVLKKDQDDLLKEIKKNQERYKIYEINQSLKNHPYHTTVYNRMEYEIRKRHLVLKNPKKKIMDSLRIVGLNINLLNLEIKNLSSSEKRLIELAICLITNPDCIIIEEPFKELDKIHEKSLFMLLQKIKDQYNKTIIFISEDVNILYQYTNKCVLLQKKEIIEKETIQLFQDIEFLKKNKINIPDIVEITHLAKKKKHVKLEYHKDIRDIIKDIYKHV